jgi:hypothetical protein
MKTKLQSTLLLLIALGTAFTLLLALPAGLGAFAVAHNTAANWHDFTPVPDAWLNTTPVQTSVIVSDSDGLSNDAAYQYSADGINWSAWLTDNLQITGTISTTRQLTITALAVADGVHAVRYIITDALGIAETSPAATFQVDTQAPAAPAGLTLRPNGWQTATAPTWKATWQNPAELSGVAAACYKIGAAPTHPQDGHCTSANNITSIDTLSPTQEGSFDFYLWLQDAAGNSTITNTAVLTQSIQWDKTEPNLFLDVFGTIGQAAWYTSTVNINIMASDNQSGLDSVRYKLGDTPWQEGRTLNLSAAGIHTFTAQAIDVAQNQKTLEPRIFKVDLAAPTTSLTISGTAGPENWYESAVSIDFAVSDDASGPQTTHWQMDDEPWQQSSVATVDADGEHSLHYFSSDVAGHAEAPRETLIKVDQHPPVTSYAVLSSHAAVNGWYRQPVTITLVPVDDGIGVQNTHYRVNDGPWQEGTTFTLTTSADYAINFYSVDALNHEETVASIPDGVHIDTIPPRAPSPLAVTPGVWTRTNSFDLLFALPTDLSGIDGAYIKVGEPPLSPTDGQWHEDVSNTLTQIQVPNEGAYKAYIWLRDQAGNVDHGNYGVWEDALSLKYDATPPLTHLAVQGDVGKNGWYTSPITITFVPTDALSGPAATWVSINGGPQAEHTALTLTQQSKHVLRYHTLDVAGNQEEDQFATFRIDYQAPGSPSNVTVQPLTWTNSNTFTLTWNNPADVSGIGAAYYAIGHAPAGPEDGTQIAATGVVSGITAPGEGLWDLYLWVEDKAGNVDVRTMVHQKNALHYDKTPPRSILKVTKGTLGDNDWYITPVTLAIDATDLASGPAGVRYRINGDDWHYQAKTAYIHLGHTGQFEIDYQSVDNANNLEAPQHILISVDLDAPRARFAPIDRYQRISNFVLHWIGSDQPRGSGLNGFQVQARDGRNGAWTTWVNLANQEPSRRYYGDYGHRYFFRVRAQDKAGHFSPWQELPWGIYVDRLQNGDFGNGDFGAWQHGGRLLQSIHPARGPQGNTVSVAELGTEAYGASNNFDVPGNVPVGCAAITQTVRIPGSAVLGSPMLTFWYRMRTYDAEYSERFNKIYDTLDVHLHYGDEDHLVLRTGQPYDEWKKHDGKKLADLGWRQAFIPIPRSMIDEIVTISIENWNRNDNWLNTWTQVTDIRLWEPHQLFLPNLASGRAAVTTAQQPATSAHSAQR